MQLCSALRDTSKFECKTASCTRKACCAVMSLEINNNEVGRWLAGFVRGWTITERHRPDRNMHPITKQRQ